MSPEPQVQRSRLAPLVALLRVEWRTRRRAPGHSLLTSLALALPVAAIALGGALLRTVQPTSAERLAVRFGAGELRIDGPTRAQAARLLEPFAGQLEGSWMWSDTLRLRAPGIELGVRAMAVEPGPAAVGLLCLDSAGAQLEPGQCLLAPGLWRRLSATPGEEFELGAALGSKRLAPGAAALPEDLAAPLLLVAPEALPAGVRGALLLRRIPQLSGGSEAERLPPLARLALQAQRAGFAVASRPKESSPDGLEAVALFVLGGFALFQASLLIAAALAVGLARRRRELGLMQANGASSSWLLAAAVAATALEALVAGLLGSACGGLLALLLAPFLDRWNGRFNGPIELSWTHLWGGPLLAVCVAVAAVGWPARGALRVPIVESLHARRPLRGGAGASLLAALLLSGASALTFGLGLRAQGQAGAPLLLASAGLGLLALCCLAPSLLGALAAHCSGLPLAWRVAGRDAGRFRGRDGAVVSASLCAGAFTVTLLLLTQSVGRALEDLPGELPPDLLRLRGESAPQLAAALAAEWQDAAVAPLAAVWSGAQPLRWLGPAQAQWIAVAEPTLLACYGLELPAAAAASARLDWLGAGPAPAARFDPHFEGLLLLSEQPMTPTPKRSWRAPQAFLAPQHLGPLGLTQGPPPGFESVPWVVSRRGPLRTSDLERARELAAGFPGTRLEAQLLEGLPRRLLPRSIVAWAWLAGGVISAVAGALALSETRRDQATLFALGAAPSLLRRMQASRLAYLAALGAWLALPAGALPVLGLLPLANIPIALRAPWPELCALLFGLPALAYGGSLLLWRPPPMRRA